MAVKWVFSQGRQLLHFTRNRLSPLTLRAHLCLGSWSRLDLIQMSDLVKAMPSGTKRKRWISTEHDSEAVETHND